MCYLRKDKRQFPYHWTRLRKIITAYFKPVYTTSGVSYPLMQWYAYENKIDTWDKDALNKFNASIYGFKEEPIKAAEFALQFCRSFGEKDFIDLKQ